MIWISVASVHAESSSQRGFFTIRSWSWYVKKDFSLFFIIFQLHINVSGICFLFVLFQRTRCIFYVGLLSFLHFNGMSVALQWIAAQAFAELCRRNLRIPEQDILHIACSIFCNDLRWGNMLIQQASFLASKAILINFFFYEPVLFLKR